MPMSVNMATVNGNSTSMSITKTFGIRHCFAITIILIFICFLLFQVILAPICQRKQLAVRARARRSIQWSSLVGRGRLLSCPRTSRLTHIEV